MKREVGLLRQKAVNSLILAIDHFNRPWDQGRTDTVLILLDHSFEMLLKAAILHRGGKIRDRDHPNQTLGFQGCLNVGLLHAEVKFLTKDQVLALQVINTLRDAAQHHLVELSEPHLYMHSITGVTLFSDLFEKVFGEKLATQLPERVLPVSTTPPKDLTLLMEDEVNVVRELLKPGKRRRVEAKARLRALAIMEGATRGEHIQPSDASLQGVASAITEGRDWGLVFPGIASLQISENGEGIPFTVRIERKEGVPVQLVKEGDPAAAQAAVVAVKTVDDRGFYSLSHEQLAAKIGHNRARTTALVRCLKVKDDSSCYKEYHFGTQKHPRYSEKAVEKITSALPTLDMDKVWREFGAYRKPRKRA